jgi:hypothetical protein
VGFEEGDEGFFVHHFQPSSLALVSLEPAPGPATTQWVFADTEPETLAPRLSRVCPWRHHGSSTPPCRSTPRSRRTAAGLRRLSSRSASACRNRAIVSRIFSHDCHSQAAQKTRDRIRLLLRQRLTHVQPVSIHHRFQRAEFVRQFLRPTGADRRNVQFVEEATQRRAGRKLGAQLTLILNLQTMPSNSAITCWLCASSKKL